MELDVNHSSAVSEEVLTIPNTIRAYRKLFRGFKVRNNGRIRSYAATNIALARSEPKRGERGCTINIAVCVGTQQLRRGVGTRAVIERTSLGRIVALAVLIRNGKLKLSSMIRSVNELQIVPT